MYKNFKINKYSINLYEIRNFYNTRSYKIFIAEIVKKSTQTKPFARFAQKPNVEKEIIAYV